MVAVGFFLFLVLFLRLVCFFIHKFDKNLSKSCSLFYPNLSSYSILSIPPDCKRSCDFEHNDCVEVPRFFPGSRSGWAQFYPRVEGQILLSQQINNDPLRHPSRVPGSSHICCVQSFRGNQGDAVEIDHWWCSNRQNFGSLRSESHNWKYYQVGKHSKRGPSSGAPGNRIS